MNAFSCDSICIIKLECNDTREGYVFNVYNRSNGILIIRLSTFEQALTYVRDFEVGYEMSQSKLRFEENVQ